MQQVIPIWSMFFFSLMRLFWPVRHILLKHKRTRKRLDREGFCHASLPLLHSARSRFNFYSYFWRLIDNATKCVTQLQRLCAGNYFQYIFKDQSNRFCGSKEIAFIKHKSGNQLSLTGNIETNAKITSMIQVSISGQKYLSTTLQACVCPSIIPIIYTWNEWNEELYIPT